MYLVMLHNVTSLAVDVFVAKQTIEGMININIGHCYILTADSLSLLWLHCGEEVM